MSRFSKAVMTHSPSLQQKFDSVLTPFAQQKAKFPPIREYCVRILGVKFTGDHAFCPVHTGHGGHSFQITDKTQKWQCWGRHHCARHGTGTIDRGQPCTCRGDVLDLHMLKFTFDSKWEAIASLIRGDSAQLLPVKADKFLVGGQQTLNGAGSSSAVNESRVARALEEFAFVTPEYLRSESAFRRPTAFCFANVFREILQPEDLPIVFRTKFEAIIGRKALDLLQEVPDSLQYLGRWTAKDAKGSNTLDNLAERLFVNVESPPGENLQCRK